MEEKDYLDLLAKREIQPTAIRILVLQAMLKAGRSVSLLDLEKILDTVDKSSIFRTITLFLSHHLVHSIDDGTGSFKYAVCSAGCSCEVNDLHMFHVNLQSIADLPNLPHIIRQFIRCFHQSLILP